MGEATRLPQLPPGQDNFAGYPNYEALLARDCPYLGKPCTREQCKKWSAIIVHVPNKLAPTQMEGFELHQCQDDGTFQAVVQTANMLAQNMISAQMEARQEFIKRHGNSGQGPSPFGPQPGPRGNR